MPAQTQTEQGEKLSMLNKKILRFTLDSSLLKQISLLPIETNPPPTASIAMQTRSKTDMESMLLKKQ